MSIFFDSDFENALIPGGTNADGWTYQTNGANAALLSSSPDQFRTGTQSLKVIYDVSDGTSSPSPQITHTFTTVGPSGQPGGNALYGRMYHRLAPGFSVGSTFYSKQILWQGTSPTVGSGYPRIWLYLTDTIDGGNFYLLSVESSFDDLTFPVQTVTTQQASTSWRLVEWAIVFNAPGQANGSLFMWLDGVQAINHNGNRQFVGPATSSLTPQGLPCPSDMTYSTCILYRQSGLGTIYFDRLAVGSTRIGAVGSDTQAPGTPTGLTVS